ncbi:molybdopterin dinucleotide binding domain-containing protein [Streptomyces sp. NPDC048504]|uniref:molybdopterin dinucleotide binding domain-containing protein n=1 Tax=Streptomyces sp. NPDC048504 TaxID=3365559 RepID=UPI00371A820F
MAGATLPDSKTPWEWYAEDYDRVRDAMARVLPGFEDFNRRVREPLGFRIVQAARGREFHTASGRAEFHTSELPDVTPPQGMRVRSTMRSHDQWNTTVYSDDDRCRRVKNLRPLLFMNPKDMADRGLAEFDLIDIMSHARDGSTRAVYGYRVIAYDIPPASVASHMPELTIPCGLDDYSRQSHQPLMKHQLVTVTPSHGR